MKRKPIPAILILIFSALIVTGSLTFLSACVHEDGTFGACHWAERMLTGLGCVTCALAGLALFCERARLGIYMSLIPCSVLGILTPGILIDLCHMSTMRCRAVMRPAMVILFSAVLISAAIGVIRRKGR